VLDTTISCEAAGCAQSGTNDQIVQLGMDMANSEKR